MTRWLEQAQERLAPFAALVFDLDMTLVALAVDWGMARREMVDVAARDFGRSLQGRSVWGFLRRAEGPLRDALETVLRQHEERGARRSTRLPLADLLPRLPDAPRGVVSLNARSACLIALERHGLTPFVEAVVAREDAGRLKPDPEPLLRCLDRLDRPPESSVFVGDRERDRETARRAGTAFILAAELAPP